MQSVASFSSNQMSSKQQFTLPRTDAQVTTALSRKGVQLESVLVCAPRIFL